jgi:putative transposase
MLRGLLRGEGVIIGREMVRMKMRRMHVEALYRRPNTSKPCPGHKIYPYLLRGLAVERPNQVWCMDITYIPMAHGFVYLAVVVDWFSRRVLAWRVSITMEVNFCLEAVEEALARSPCVRGVAARIGSEPMGAQEDGRGSIRTAI